MTSRAPRAQPRSPDEGNVFINSGARSIVRETLQCLPLKCESLFLLHVRYV